MLKCMFRQRYPTSVINMDEIQSFPLFKPTPSMTPTWGIEFVNVIDDSYGVLKWFTGDLICSKFHPGYVARNW